MTAAAVSPGGLRVADPSRHARALRLAWEEFCLSGVVLPIVRPPIADSWRRARALGISTSLQVRPVAHGLDRLLASQVRQSLVAAAQKVMTTLADQSDSLALTLTVTDADGLILGQSGDAAMLARGARMGIVPGTRWAEFDVGTNGIGMALTSGQTMQVFAAEHFCEAFHGLTCTAAPVRHALTRQVLGVVDVTASYDEATSNVRALTAQSAELIQRELRELMIAGDRQLLEALSSVREGLAAYATDLHGRRTIGNHGATAMIAPEDHAALWGLVQRALAAPDQRFIPYMLCSGRAVLVQIYPVLLGDEPVGSLVILRDPRRVAPAAAAARQPAPSADWKPFSSAAPWLGPARACVSSNEPVLIVGEVGAGKSTLALALHRQSSAASRALLTLDGALVSKRAWEARWRLACKLGRADMLLIERLLDLPPSLQAQLVAWLDATPAANRPRILSTAAVDSEEELRSSGLRLDLLDRLAVNVVRVPPLRERADEIELIAAEVLGQLEPALFQRAEPISPQARAALRAYRWPGNVRQLQNVLRRAVLFRPRAPLEPKALPPEIVLAGATQRLGRIERLEVETILETLRATGNNVTRAAELVGLSRATLYRRLHAYRSAIRRDG
jgi:transcriptional regulator of acetoin/glycerol metabolism